MDALIRLTTGLDVRDPSAHAATIAAARTADARWLAEALRRIPDQAAADPAKLRAVRTPAVVAAWTGDRIIHPHAVAQQVAALLPNARFETIPRCNRSLPYELADEVAERVRGWYQELTGTTVPGR